MVVVSSVGSDLAWNVVLVDDRLLEKHVQAALVLRQRVTGDPGQQQAAIPSISRSLICTV